MNIKGKYGSVFSDPFCLIGLLIPGGDILADDSPPVRCDKGIEGIHADQFIKGITGHVSKTLVAIQDNALVMNENAAGGGIVKHPVPRLTLL